MLDSLLVAGDHVERLLELTLRGIHTEKLGSGNQPWDRKVAETVATHCSQAATPRWGLYRWYAVHLRWFVKSAYRCDLDNLRFKPVLDQLTANRFWPDDNIDHVRAIYNEVVRVNTSEDERVEIRIWGAPQAHPEEEPWDAS